MTVRGGEKGREGGEREGEETEERESETKQWNHTSLQRNTRLFLVWTMEYGELRQTGKP